MNTLRMPGFTAETSLYQTDRSYQGFGRYHAANGSVHPAILDPFCVDDCLEKCSVSKLPQACFNHCIKRCPGLTAEQL
jgi:hypothetical protein